MEICDKINYKFIENDAEKFCTIKINIRDLNEDYNDYIYNEIENNKDRIENSITRIIIDMNVDQILNDKKIYQLINSFNAKYILNIQKNYNAKKHIRNSQITNELSIEKSLELYFENKTRAKERILLGKEICSKMEE